MVAVVCCTQLVPKGAGRTHLFSFARLQGFWEQETMPNCAAHASLAARWNKASTTRDMEEMVSRVLL
jgi:hypothetical protein